MAVREEVLSILIRCRDDASKALAATGAEAEGVGSRVGNMVHGLQIGMAAAGVAAAGVIALSVKQAADYQELVTALVTGAGESKANIDLVCRACSTWPARSA